MSTFWLFKLGIFTKSDLTEKGVHLKLTLNGLIALMDWLAITLPAINFLRVLLSLKPPWTLIFGYGAGYLIYKWVLSSQN